MLFTMILYRPIYSGNEGGSVYYRRCRLFICVVCAVGTSYATTNTRVVYTANDDDDNIQGAVKRVACLCGMSVCMYIVYAYMKAEKNVIKTEWKNKCNGFRFM